MAQQSLGPVRCPACGQKALPHQSRCLSCNALLEKAVPAEPSAGEAIQPAPLPLLPIAEGKYPGCGHDLATEAVLCIQCGYNQRT